MIDTIIHVLGQYCSCLRRISFQCGYLGDKLGRRNLLLGTVTVMGLASVLIGFLPTYASIGVSATILLVALRIIQGFALGGESTGAQLMALEHANADWRGEVFGSFGHLLTFEPDSRERGSVPAVSWARPG